MSPPLSFAEAPSDPNLLIVASRFMPSQEQRRFSRLSYEADIIRIIRAAIDELHAKKNQEKLEMIPDDIRNPAG